MSKKITIIIVIYEIKIFESPTILGLVQASQQIDFKNVSLIIYDNSKIGQDGFFIPFSDFRYIHDESNGGVCAAYNYALKHSIDNEIQWIMLLDHDTSVTSEYFGNAFSVADELADNDDMVCILPHTITDSGKSISPSQVSIMGWSKSIEDRSGPCSIPITGINSGTLLRTLFVSSIGGFNTEFKLDMLDHWYYNEIFRRGKLCYILNISLKHSLSVSNYDSLNIGRYKSILDSEALFMEKYKDRKYFFVYIFRLFFRFIKQIVMLTDKRIAILTLKKSFKLTKYILCDLQ